MKIKIDINDVEISKDDIQSLIRNNITFKFNHREIEIKDGYIYRDERVSWNDYAMVKKRKATEEEQEQYNKEVELLKAIRFIVDNIN